MTSLSSRKTLSPRERVARSAGRGLSVARPTAAPLTPTPLPEERGFPTGIIQTRIQPTPFRPRRPLIPAKTGISAHMRGAKPLKSYDVPVILSSCKDAKNSVDSGYREIAISSWL
jgi:hypothetical protein